MGVKGNLRLHSRERRHGVQGSPRPARLSFTRRNERSYDWDRRPPLPRWYDALLFAAFVIGFAVTFAYLAHIGLERSGR